MRTNTPFRNTRIKRFLRALSLPVRLIARVIRQLFPHNRAQGEVTVGVIIVYFGAWLAEQHPTFVPHFVWEGSVWALHGFGLAPIIEHVLGESEPM